MACSFLYSTFLKCYHYHKSYEIEVEVYNISGGTRVSTAMYRRWYTAACICIMQYQLSMISSTFQQSLMFSHDKFNISLKYLNYASKNAFIHINSPMYYCLKPHHQYPLPPGINDVPCTDIRDTPRQTSDTTEIFVKNQQYKINISVKHFFHLSQPQSFAKFEKEALYSLPC